MEHHFSDWKSLQFSCRPEQKPPVDQEADKLFRKARELEKKNNQANDRAMCELYQEAADKGHHKAMLNLAGLYIRGTGVPEDEGRAVDFVEKALRLTSRLLSYGRHAATGSRYQKGREGCFELLPTVGRSG